MLKFRPHHFLCTLAFEGKGYSDEFVRNFSEIVKQLQSSSPPSSLEKVGDESEIQVVDVADSICMPCPNREGSGCVSREKISQLDKEHAFILGFKPGDQLTWGEAKKLLAQKMQMEDFNRACAPCSWKTMGVCEGALKKLKDSLLNNMKIIGVMAFFSWALVQGNSVPAFAQKTTELQSVDELRELLKSPTKSSISKKKRVPLITEKIAKSYDLLRKGKRREASHLAETFQKDPLFSDYGYWIEGSSWLESAHQALRTHQYKTAQKYAQAAIRDSLQILGGSPYSPWIRMVPRVLGSAELVQAAASCGLRQWHHCLDQFEGAFQRLVGLGQGSGDLWSVQPEFFQAYGLACSKTDSERCTPWVAKLMSVFLKNSVELKALAKAFPSLIPTVEAKLKSTQPVNPRSTKSYRAPDLDQAAFDAAMNDYLDKKYSSSIRLFQQFLQDYSKSAYRFRAQYWLARALSQEGQPEEAKKIYETISSESPLTFYGMLAAQTLVKDVGSAISATVPLGMTRDPGLSPLELFRLHRAELLIKGGGSILASFELKDLKARESLSNPFLIYLATLQHEVGNHLSSFSILSELIQRGYSGVYTSYVLKYIFPVPFFDSIQAAAVENKLDPILLLSLIKQESSFDAKAVSSVGAQGLTQLMPATALDVSPEVIRAELLDIGPNVRTGAKYLSRLLTRFKGNIVLALAGYNAGPGAVDRWVKANSQRKDILEFIESIPYRETREYVIAIIRNYFWYSRFLKKDTLSLDSFWANYSPDQQSEEKLN